MPERRASCALGLILLAASACSFGGSSPAGSTAPAPPVVKLAHVDIPPLAGRTASFEQLLVDQDAHLLYAANRTDRGLDLFDVSTSTARYLKTIALPKEPYSLALDSVDHRLFVGMDGGTVGAIDSLSVLKSAGTIQAQLATGGTGPVQYIGFDSADRKLYAVNGDEAFMTVIDARAVTAGKRIAGHQKLGQATYDPLSKLVYVAGTGENAVITVDPATDTVRASQAIGQECGPSAVAFRPGGTQALLACSSAQHLLAWDMQANKVIGSSIEAGGADQAIYSAKLDRFIVVASGYKPVPEVALYTTSPVRYSSRFRTTAGCHSVAYDETNKVVYIPDQLLKGAGLFAYPVSG